MKTPPESFKPLEIRRKDVELPQTKQYRVYSSNKDFVVVSAQNVQMAILSSGIVSPLRVEGHEPLKDAVVNIHDAPNVFTRRPNVAHMPMDGHKLFDVPTYQPEPSVLPLPQAGEEAAPEAKVEAPPESAALSNDDVEKLLAPDQGS